MKNYVCAIVACSFAVSGCSATGGSAAGLPSLYPVSAINAEGVVDDPTTKTYIVAARGRHGGLYRLRETTAGVGPDGYVPENWKPKPVAVITSDTCASQLALGFKRTIYATQSVSGGGCASDAVDVYAPDAKGNASPVSVLTGPATQLNEPYGIYVGQ
jgi:hypothetical protein